MKLTDFSRIKGAVDMRLMAEAHIVVVGVGGAYALCQSFARSGIGRLTAVDFDVVEEVNIVRQGYRTSDIGKRKVHALGESLWEINDGMAYKGIAEKVQEIPQHRMDDIFTTADLLLFLADSFQAQSFGNKLAIRYGKPAIWAGFYEKSRCAEIVFYIPGITPACFRCAVSPRYEAQEAAPAEIVVSSACNTIFHSQLLDSFIGMLALAILHRHTEGYEFSGWFGKQWDRNFIQFKVHPEHGLGEGSLFERTFRATEDKCPTFVSIWQKVERDEPPKYAPCPDCLGGQESC